jgi:simple sugar transport system permease protein
MQVPSSFILALNGLVVIFVVSSELWRRRRQRKRLIEATTQAEKEPGLVPESGVTS